MDVDDGGLRLVAHGHPPPHPMLGPGRVLQTGRPSSKGCSSHNARLTAEFALLTKKFFSSSTERRVGKTRLKSRASENFDELMAALPSEDHRRRTHEVGRRGAPTMPSVGMA